MIPHPIELRCPAKYDWLMKWEGALYPVTNMIRVTGEDTMNIKEAFTVVIWRGLNQWQTISECHPDEFVKRESGNDRRISKPTTFYRGTRGAPGRGGASHA